MSASTLSDILGFVESEIGSRRHTSTQEDAWLVLAARALEEANKGLELAIDGTAVRGAISEQVAGDQLIEQPILIENRGPDAVSAVVTTLASPKQPLRAVSNGYQIKRQYFRLDGTETTLNQVRQNERFVVVLTVTEFDNRSTQVLVSDLLAGGFEIDNPRLVRSAELENFKWLGETKVAHTEARNDRFVAAYERQPGDPRTFNLAYIVRAVTPGRYTHPAASVEDMYRPEQVARTATGFIEILPAQ